MTWQFTLTGLLIGVLVGMTGMGGGSLMTPILPAAALLWVAGFGHFIAGNVDTSTVGWLLIGSIPGVVVGSQLSLSIPERPLRMVLATVLGLSGLKLLDVPGATIAIVVVLLIGLTGLLAWIARRSWVRRQRVRSEQLAAQRLA